MILFLLSNKIEIEYTQDELVDVILKVADDKYGFNDLLTWILNHQI